MKVLFLINTTGKNVWERAENFEKYLRKRKVEIESVRVERDRIEDIPRFLNTIVTHVKDADIIHIFEPFPPTIPFFLPLFKILGKKVIIDTGDLHTSVSKLGREPWIRTLFIKFCEKMAFIFCDKIIVRGRGLYRILIDLFGIKKEKVVWITDGVDLKRFRPRNSKKMKKKLGIKNSFIIGYASNYRAIRVGKRVLSRGWELVFLSKRLMKSGYKNFKILFIGKGKFLSNLKKMVEENGVKRYVIFTGFVKDALYPLYINAIDVGFYEAYKHLAYEAMNGTKMREYLASGKPVISGKIGEARYVLKDCGVLVEPFNLTEREMERYLRNLFRKVVFLLKNKRALKEMGKKARKVAEEIYNWSKISEMVYNLYVKLL